jgi:hypothetical protein
VSAESHYLNLSFSALFRTIWHYPHNFALSTDFRTFALSTKKKVEKFWYYGKRDLGSFGTTGLKAFQRRVTWLGKFWNRPGLEFYKSDRRSYFNSLSHQRLHCNYSNAHTPHFFRRTIPHFLELRRSAVPHYLPHLNGAPVPTTYSLYSRYSLLWGWTINIPRLVHPLQVHLAGSHIFLWKWQMHLSLLQYVFLQLHLPRKVGRRLLGADGNGGSGSRGVIELEAFSSPPSVVVLVVSLTSVPAGQVKFTLVFRVQIRRLQWTINIINQHSCTQLNADR